MDFIKDQPKSRRTPPGADPEPCYRVVIIAYVNAFGCLSWGQRVCVLGPDLRAFGFLAAPPPHLPQWPSAGPSLGREPGWGEVRWEKVLGWRCGKLERGQRGKAYPKGVAFGLLPSREFPSPTS